MPTRAFAEIRTARHSQHSRNPFHAGPVFEASLVRHCYGLPGCSPPWTDLTEFPRPPGAFTSRLPAGRSPFPPLDMTTTDGVMGLAWMSCAVRWSSPDRMEVRGHGMHQPQASRTEDDHGALCRFGRVLERDVGLHRGWRGQDHPRDESGLRA